jgi:hypothetical protein
MMDAKETKETKEKKTKAKQITAREPKTNKK